MSISIRSESPAALRSDIEESHGAETRFWARVDRSGPCWLWLGGKDQDGYGQFMVSYRNYRAHRFAYALLIGPIPEGMQLDHLCRKPNCVNPAHLEPVTNRVNVLRGVGITAQNARKDACPRGHPYDTANTFLKRGKRHCRECNRVACREYGLRRRRSA